MFGWLQAQAERAKDQQTAYAGPAERSVRGYVLGAPSTMKPMIRNSYI